MRTLLAVLAPAGAAALGGAVLGEYTLTGVAAVVACVLFGLVVGETAVAVRRRAAPVVVGAAAASAPVAWVWSLWISTGHHLGYASPAQWLATPFAAAAAAGWVLTAGRPGSRPARKSA